MYLDPKSSLRTHDAPRDAFGRTIDYLRISLIDQCNMRCVYCMPLRGLSFIPSDELLTASELEVVAQAAADLGFRKIRFTGGEPTLRDDLLEIVERVHRAAPDIFLSMTTNAVLLPRLAQPLKKAGLSRVNIHIDVLDPQRLRRIMRFADAGKILTGIEAAEQAGLCPIKINAVVARGYNEQDAVSLAELTLKRDWHVRFIELMPLGGGECASVALSSYVPNPETKDRIEAAVGPLQEIDPVDPSDESRNFRFENAAGVVGFISPVSEPYCGNCNRMRLTADGKFHLCLLNDDELDIKSALRRGGQVEDVAALLLRGVERKPTGHRLDQGVSTLDREMFQIGG